MGFATVVVPRELSSCPGIHGRCAPEAKIMCSRGETEKVITYAPWLAKKRRKRKEQETRTYIFDILEMHLPVATRGMPWFSGCRGKLSFRINAKRRELEVQ